MRTLIIIILILLVIGLYFYTGLTKDLIMVTGEFLKDKAVGLIN